MIIYLHVLNDKTSCSMETVDLDSFASYVTVNIVNCYLSFSPQVGKVSNSHQE